MSFDFLISMFSLAIELRVICYYKGMSNAEFLVKSI